MGNADKPDLKDVKVGVIGAGTWGTAIASLLAGKGLSVALWAFEEEVKHEIETLGENKTFLPGMPLPKNITPSNDLSDVASNKDVLVLVVPSHIFRNMAMQVAEFAGPETKIVSASKGIELETDLTMHGILQQAMPKVPDGNLAVISGPTFAKEVVSNVPSVAAVASSSLETAEFLQQVFATPFFRVYTNTDVIGVELGGAVKNVIAIASGIVDGMGFGLNTRAAIITRGLAEITRLGARMGAAPDTFSGITGVGDLILTCTGTLSRNYTVGRKLGEGMKLSEILAEMKMVAEGVKNAESIYNLSKRLGVEMPITFEVYNILYKDSPPADAVGRLMTRDLKPEKEEY